ncbi:MAG TPA: hypothetical protein VFC59_10290 [Cryobacterium sp.]|nr:hypothetical protein [Cryobacterium sp.]
MNERYGIDLSDPGVLSRPSRWLRVRIHGLLTVPYSHMAGPAGIPVPYPATRLQAALDRGGES